MGCVTGKQNAQENVQVVRVNVQENVRENVRVSEVQRVEEGNYKLPHLLEITESFSCDREIGRGGFGTVYKGTLPDGGFVAVKRLVSSLSINNTKQFANEVSNLMGLEHSNIVRLLGYCHGTRLRQSLESPGQVRPIYVEVEERLLCFEYLTNGSLDNELSDQTRGFDWGMHFEIIKGITLGLCFLHEQAQNGPIIHLDLKPSNILLDGNMIPKIGDFGLSRLFGPDKTRTITSKVVGSRGYMAPEYYLSGEISAKADVFSFGILILEVMTGESKPADSTDTLIEQYTTKVRKNWSTLSQIRSRYPSLEPDCHKEVKGCIEIGLQCVEIDPVRRPTAGQIVYMLHILPQLKYGQIFCIDESSRKIGYTLSGRALNLTGSNDTRYWMWRSVRRSRFPKCPVLRKVRLFRVSGEIPTRDLFADTTYKVYLVYRLRKYLASGFDTNQTSSIKLPSGREIAGRSVCLDRVVDEEDDVTYPAERGDGWMELELGSFDNDDELQEEGAVIADVYEMSGTIWKKGLIIEGMEFRPWI